MKNNRLDLRIIVATLLACAIAYGLFIVVQPGLNAQSIKPGISNIVVGTGATILFTAFLVSVFSTIIIRHENNRLTILNEKIAHATRLLGIQSGSKATSDASLSFSANLEQFVQLAEEKISQINKDVVASQATLHLLTYKQEKAESALNSIPDAALVIDDACMPVFANLKVEPILGASRETILGHQPQDWCHHKEVLAFLMRFKNTAASVRMASMEYMPEENSDRRISVSAYPLLSPRDPSTLFGMLILFRDITKEHLAKQAGAEFVAHVSHELKTPLNTLSAYSELLLGYASLAEHERVEAVNVIHSEVDRMSNLINNLLNISKIETGTMKLNRKRVKMQDLLEDTFSNMHTQALGKDISLDLKIPADLGSVRLDKDMFRIAINNLVSNAIKYSDAGSTVILSARVLDDDQMQISVKDHGIGISTEDQANIFLKYYRAKNASTLSRSGHGLGLFLAKQIVEMHHGSIAVKSELGKGTEFIITFKAQPVQLEESLAA